MRIKAIDVVNFLGLRHFSINLKFPLTVIAGLNHCGKTALVDAIKFALIGEPTRVNLKKDFKELVSEDADSGQIKIVLTDNGVDALISRNIQDGKGAPPIGNDNLKFTLDMHAFSSLQNKERQEFLYKLMGLKITSAEVRQRLAARGIVDEQKIMSIFPLLRSGFDIVFKEAKNRRTEARGAWKAVTGETYGSVKAETWSAPFPTQVASTDIKENKIQLEKLNQAIAAGNQQIGVIQTRLQDKERCYNLSQVAETLESLKIDYEHCQTQVDNCQDEINITQTKLANLGVIDSTYTCPACGIKMAYDKEKDQMVRSHRNRNSANNRLELENLLTSLQTKFAYIKQQLKQKEAALQKAISAQQTLATIGDVNVCADDLKTEQAKLCQVCDKAAIVSEKVNEHDEFERKRKAAKTATEKARQYHQDISDWEQLCRAFAPDGILGDILKESLAPINRLLEKTADITGWPTIKIEQDMTIRADGRRFNLLSESEQWRADAAISVAITLLSKSGLLVFDRMDVLDLPSRTTFLKWIYGLRNEIGTVIVLATLKDKQQLAKMPSDIGRVWMEHEIIVRKAA